MSHHTHVKVFIGPPETVENEMNGWLENDHTIDIKSTNISAFINTWDGMTNRMSGTSMVLCVYDQPGP